MPSDQNLGRTGAWLRSAMSILVVITAWEAAARAHLVPMLFLPSFLAVIEQAGALIADGTLPADLGLSLYRAFAGLALAATAGIGIGLMMARSRFAHWLADPVVSLAFPSPKIAFLPVFVLWFGIDSLSKILLVTFACVFPIIIGTYNAAISVNRVLLWSARSMGTSSGGLLLHVVLPACYPRIFASMRVALPVALVTTFTTEMVAGGGGMGASLIYAQRFFDSPTVFAYILAMLVVGLILDAAITALRDRFRGFSEPG